MMEDGRVGGERAWKEADFIDKEERKEAGRVAWMEATEEERAGMMKAGRVCEERAWKVADFTDQEERKEAGRKSNRELDDRRSNGNRLRR